MESREMELRKTLESLTSTAFAYGGALNPEQSTKFIQMVRDNSAALSDVRHVNMTRTKMDIDRLYVGEPVTRGVAQQTAHPFTALTNPQRPSFKKIQLNVEDQKLQSFWPMTYESMQVAIEQGPKLEKSIFESASKAITSDMENLFWNGDTSITVTAAPTPTDALLVTVDGIGVLSQSGHVVDADGANVELDMFAAAIRAMPKHISNQANDLMWWMSTDIAVDWITKIAGRATVKGDSALEGAIVAPYGIPIWRNKRSKQLNQYGVPWMPSDLALPVATATSAQIISSRQGVFEFDATHNAITFNIDAIGAIAAVFTSGVFTSNEVARTLNDLIIAAGGGYTSAYYHCWSDDGYGHLVCTSPTTGAASTVVISGGIANPARIRLGLDIDPTGAIVAVGDNNTYTGAAAGANTIKEGSYILLTPAENMIWAAYTGPAGGKPGDGIRVYSKFEPEYDALTIYFYTQIDIAVEQTEAMVRVDNVRRMEYL